MGPMERMMAKKSDKSKADRPQNKNLIPIKKGELSKEEATKRGRAGGIASARARQERRTLKETLEYLLKMPVDSGPSYSVTGADSLRDAKLKNAPSGEVIGIALMGKALKGDLRAIEMIQEITGERNVTTVSPLEALASKLEEYAEEDD